MIEVYQVLEDLERRLSNLLRVGIIQNKGGEPADRVRVKIGELHTAPLRWLTHRAGNDRDWWKPEDGEQVLVLSPSGDLAQGVVLPALYRDQYPAPVTDPDKRVSVFSDGAWIEYDRQNHHLKATLPAGATTELTSTGGIQFNGDLSVNGNISSTKNISAAINVSASQNVSAGNNISDKTRSMAADRAIYNGHTHPGVQSGPGNTGSASQKQ